MSTATRADRDLITGIPAKAILFFSVPIILGNLLQQFYNMVDAVVASNFIGLRAMAGIGASYSITNVYLAFALGGCIGSAVVISQFFGAGRLTDVRTSITTLLVNFICLGTALGLVGVLTCRLALEALNTPAEVMADAIVYLDIYFWGLPFLFLYNACTAILNSLGDSKTPLKLLLFSSVLNIILDLLFVIVFKQGVSGVAVATLIAQGAASLLSLFVVWRRVRELPRSDRFYSFEITVKMLTIAIPTTIQQCIVFVGLMLVQSVVNHFGADALAGYSAAMRFEAICVVPIIAIGNAMATYTAQNVGAGRLDRVSQGLKASTVITIINCLIIFLVFFFFGKWMLMGFLGQGDTEGMAYEFGHSYIMCVTIFFVLMGFKSIIDGVLRGAGDVVMFTVANLINLAIRVVAVFMFARTWGPWVIWYSVPVGWLANLALSGLWYMTGRWKTKSLVAAKS